mgnify:CR=1 FL=1
MSAGLFAAFLGHSLFLSEPDSSSPATGFSLCWKSVAKSLFRDPERFVRARPLITLS